MSWSRIRGHAEIVERMTRAARLGRLGHAYLFIGPTGVGKRTVGVELAKALLCEHPAGGRVEACDGCPSCRLVDAGTHPDLLQAGRPCDELVFSVDEIRELCRQLSLTPIRGRRRVAVVDDADDFSTEAANAFLKTLEEPPPGSLLILLGTGADRQLPTIRSRCQLINFGPLDAELVADRLRAAGVTDAALIRSLVAFADGSPGRALAAADPALWAVVQRFVNELAQPKPDAPASAREWKEHVEAAGKDAASQRGRADLLIAVAAHAVRQALMSSLGLDAGNGDAAIDRLAQRHGPDGLLARLDRLLEAEAHVDRRVQTVLLVEAAVDALCLESTTRRLLPGVL
jgi:DNA polymerase-3 subunit delta'